MTTNKQERKADKVRYNNLEKSHKVQLQAQFLEQQWLRTVIQYLTTLLNTSQHSNLVNPQISLQSNIPGIPVDTSKPPPNMNQPQLHSAVNHPCQNYTTTFGLTNTNLNPNPSAIYTIVNGIEIPLTQLTLILGRVCISVSWLQKNTTLVMQQHMMAKIPNYFKICLMM